MATVVVIIVLFFVSATWYVVRGQSKYIYHPDKNIASTPASVGLEFEDLALDTEDGETIRAWFVPCMVNGMSAEQTVLLCHGNAGNMGDRVRSLQTFNKLGFNTLVFDYRGFGESSGNPTEKGTYIDGMTCWDYLVDKRKVRSQDIIIFGRSLGGAVACWLAAHADPSALVLESTFASIPAMAHEMFPFIPVKIFCRFKYDTVNNITNIHCPVMVSHSKVDSVLPYKQGLMVFEAASEPKQFVEIMGDHNDGGLDSNPHYQVELVKFLQRI